MLVSLGYCVMEAVGNEYMVMYTLNRSIPTMTCSLIPQGASMRAENKMKKVLFSWGLHYSERYQMKNN